MTTLHRLAAVTSNRVLAARSRREAGQGTIEYLGIAVVIGIIIAAVAGAGLENDIISGIRSAISKITGLG
jgi:hypothetical protein